MMPPDAAAHINDGHVVLIGLTAVIGLGVGGTWLAHALRLPAILPLLALGLIVGPWLGWMQPDDLLGEAVLPVVSLAVAVLLFDGGLSLRWHELKGVGGAVRRLISLGVIASGLLGALAARFALGLPSDLALLLGTMTVVTGPTVIVPLLRTVRLSKRVGSTLKWEGIWNDPIGVALAVLVFQVLFELSPDAAAGGIAMSALQIIVIGAGAGLAGAAALVFIVRSHSAPDYLHSPLALALVLLVYSACDQMQPESGLLAVTVMGVALANQRAVSIKHIAQFKETLGVLLVPVVFILLAARLTRADIASLDWRAVGFVAAMLFLVRPGAVLASTVGSSLTARERLFTAWIAPRGIVAAAMASIFALRLEALGHPEGAVLVPVMFSLIIATVTLHSLSAAPLARALGLLQASPQGLVIVGAHSWARALADILQREGVRSLLIDVNRQNVAQARLAGLRAQRANALAEDLPDELDLDGLGHLVALTPNDEVNALAAIQFREVFGRARIFQLAAAESEEPGVGAETARHLRGRTLFAKDATFEQLTGRFAQGHELRATSITEEFDLDGLRRVHGESALPLFSIREDGWLRVAAVDRPLRPEPGDRLITLVDTEESSAERREARGEPPRPEQST